MAELIANLGYTTKHGHNYKTIQKRLDAYQISTDHFISAPSQRKVTEEDVFCSESSVSQKTLRRFYLKKNTEYKCAVCGLGSVWNNIPLTLQVDHIDGNNHNNVLENLQWICPNCHSQTKTFAGRNLKNQEVRIKENLKKHYCIDCGVEITGQSSRCRKCALVLRRKVERPSMKELDTLLKLHKGNFSNVSKIFGVTDKAIRKWCKSYGMPTHSADYKE